MSRAALRERVRAAAVELVDALVDLLTSAGDQDVDGGLAPDSLLTVAQLAERLHRSPSTTRAWVERGLFEGAVKVGKGWLVPAGAVRTFLDRRRTVAPRTDVAPSAPLPPVPHPGAGRRRAPPAAGADADLSGWRQVRRP